MSQKVKSYVIFYTFPNSTPWDYAILYSATTLWDRALLEYMDETQKVIVSEVLCRMLGTFIPEQVKTHWHSVFYNCSCLTCNKFSFSLSLSLSRAAPMAYGGSQARGWIVAFAAGLCRSNAGSESSLQPTPSSWQHRILSPLSKARDWTHNFMVPSWIH